MDSSGAGERRRGGKRSNEDDEQPPEKEPGRHGSTPFLHGGEAPSGLPPRLVEFLPRAAQNAARSLTKRGLPAPVAEDLVQDAVLSAIRKRLDPPSHRALSRWMHVVAHRRATTWLEAEGRRWSRTVELHDELPTAKVDDIGVWIEGRELARALAEALGQLSAADRDAILAAFNEESRGESRLERNRFALRLHRARLRLMARIKEMLVLVPLRLRTNNFVTAFSQQAGGFAAAAGVVGVSALLGIASSLTGAGSLEARRDVVAASTSRSLVAVGAQGEAARTPGPETSLGSGRGRGATRDGSRPGDAHPDTKQRIEIGSPAGPVAAVGTGGPTPKAPLACLTNLPVVGTNCVSHPLRK